MSSFQEEIRTLQSKLNKEKASAIELCERLNQIRAAKRELDLQISELKLSLRKTEVRITKITVIVCSVWGEVA